jgi:ribose transport system ATP-binding protein/D-xylose transport system ATP-binding protein
MSGQRLQRLFPEHAAPVGTPIALEVELAGKGVALLIVASELEELIGLCDRCLVVADGRIVDEFGRGEGGEDRVLRSVTSAQAQRNALASQVSS